MRAFIMFLGSAAAMKMPHWVNETVICADGACVSPNMKYQQIADVQPGFQWDDAGGYCGSWATQRAAHRGSKLSIGSASAESSRNSLAESR